LAWELVYRNVHILEWEIGHHKLSSNSKPKERISLTTMAQQHYRTPFKKALKRFITKPDPFLEMLKRVITEMTRIEAEAKVGATKGKDS
jgi:hypothetical protein